MLSAVNPSIFSEWLQEILKEKNWTQADLAREAGLSRAAISNLINQQRGPGPEALIAIADALKLPPDAVFRQAGLLPNDSSPHQVAQQIAAYKLDELSESQLDEVLQFIEFIQNRDERPDKRTSYKINRKKREGSAPPEQLKD